MRKIANDKYKKIDEWKKTLNVKVKKVANVIKEYSRTWKDL